MNKLSYLLLASFLIFSFSTYSQVVTDDMKKKAYEAGKKELKNYVKSELTKQTKNELLGQMGGDAVITIFNHFEERAEVRGQIREQIENANSSLVHFRFNGHSDKINRIKISPDSRTILTGSDDGSVLFRDILTGEITKKLSYEDGVMDLKFSSDGQYLGIATSEFLEIYRFEDFEKISSIERDGSSSKAEKTASSFNFSPVNQDQVVIYTPPKTYEVYNFQTGEKLAETKLKTGSTIGKAAMFMTSTTLIMEVGDGQDLRSWMLSPDGNIVAHTQKSTFLWDIEKEDEILRYQKNKKMGFKKYIGIPVEFIENGKKLMVINDDELVIYNSDDAMLLDQTNMKIATTYGQSYEDKLLFSPDEKFFLVAGRQEENDQEIVSLDVYKTQTLTKILSFPSDLQDSKEYFHYDWSQNGRFIVKYCASCKDDGVIIYDVEEKEAVPTQTVDSQTTTSSDTGTTLDKLRKLKDLYDEGVLSDEEYERLKKEILDSNSN